MNSNQCGSTAAYITAAMRIVIDRSQVWSAYPVSHDSHARSPIVNDIIMWGFFYVKSSFVLSYCLVGNGGMPLSVVRGVLDRK